jgi:hypothetical protein
MMMFSEFSPRRIISYALVGISLLLLSLLGLVVVVLIASVRDAAGGQASLHPLFQAVVGCGAYESSSS